MSVAQPRKVQCCVATLHLCTPDHHGPSSVCLDEAREAGCIATCAESPLAFVTPCLCQEPECRQNQRGTEQAGVLLILCVRKNKHRARVQNVLLGWNSDSSGGAQDHHAVAQAPNKRQLQARRVGKETLCVLLCALERACA